MFKLPNIYLALIMSMFMFIANFLLWNLYTSIVLTVTIAYVIAFIGILFLINQYIDRNIKPGMFYFCKFMLLPMALECGLSFAAFNERSMQNQHIALHNELNVKISHNEKKLGLLVEKHNQLVLNLKNVEQIIAATCQNQSDTRKAREHEKLMSLTSSINDVSVQDNQHSVTELSNKNNLSCSKVFVQEQIKQLNEMRTHFIQISKEKEQFNNQLQLMQENNRTLKNNKQEFWPFLKEYGAIMFLAIFLNFILNMIGIKQKLNQQVLKTAQNDPDLPRDVILSKYVSYTPPPHFTEKNFWEFWKQSNARSKIYSQKRIIKLDNHNPDDVAIMNHFHSPNILGAKLLGDTEMKQWYYLNLLDDDIFNGQYRFYEFKPIMFDYYFAYNSCLK